MPTRSLFSSFYCCFILSLILLVFALATNRVAPVVTAQTPPGQGVPQAQLRQLRNEIPQHLPLRVEVRNLQTDRFAHDLEIEVTNTSDKPIYYLSLILTLTGIRGPAGSGGHEIGFSLAYGRRALLDLDERALPEDVPILPGESHTFTIPPLQREGWEQFAAQRGFGSVVPRRVRLRFRTLNFGDGTGFVTTGGVPSDRRNIRPAARSPDQGRRQVGRWAYDVFLLRGQ